MSGTELKLPAWASVSAEEPRKGISIVIDADTDGYVREWVSLLAVDTPDQYWLECAYQCAKMDLQAALMGTEFDPRTCGKSAEFRFSSAPQWALRQFPAGRGQEAASKRMEARQHYIRIRGELPMQLSA